MMSGSETESGGGSDDELTPIMDTQQYTFQKVNRHDDVVYLSQSLSQIDSMLPPASQLAPKEVDGTKLSTLSCKRSLMLVPPPATSTPKVPQKPALSEEGLKQEAIRIMKTLPRGEVTMWGIMQTIEYNDMRLLFKFKGVKVVGRANKADMGRRILKYVQRGDFQSIFKSIAEEKNGMRNLIGKEKLIHMTENHERHKSASLNSKLANDESKSNEIKGTINSVQINPFRANPGVPIPLVSVGGNKNWIPVDNCKMKICQWLLDVFTKKTSKIVCVHKRYKCLNN